MLSPATLLSSLRTEPRCFLFNEKYCCCVNVDSTHAYLSNRFCPVNSITALPVRKSVILSGVSASIFSMRICIHLAAWQTLNSRIILHWKRTPFQDHLVLDNSAGLC